MSRCKHGWELTEGPCGVCTGERVLNLTVPEPPCPSCATLREDVARLYGERQEIRRLLYRPAPKREGTVVAEFDPQPQVLDAERDLVAERDRLREALVELTALVRGECPSLLDDDSGGLGRLSVQIDSALGWSNPVKVEDAK